MFNDLILTSRTDPDEARELLQRLDKRGIVIGTDEAGRGALAGPVVAAAVYLTHEQEKDLLTMKLRDSKRITPTGREKLFAEMNKMGVLWRAYSGSVERIERDNVLRASLWTMKKCVLRLSRYLPCEPACVIVDGTEKIPELKISQWPLVRADNIIPVVSAASVIAKVIRDRLMKNFDAEYPGYNLAKNKGYPTKFHMDAVRVKGMSEIHRYSFCKKFLQTSKG